MQIAIVAPTMAVRTGLQSLLSPSAPFDENVGGLQRVNHLEVLFDAGSLEDFTLAAPDVDVLVIVEDALSEREMSEAARLYDSHLGLLLLTDDPHSARGLMTLPLRAWGVLSLDASGEEMLAAVSAIHEGLLVGASPLLERAFSSSLLVGSEEVPELVETLTERESEVLQHLARGLANKQIALALNISEHTVKFHVSSIYSKLGVTNRTEAVRVGIQCGLVSL